MLALTLSGPRWVALSVAVYLVALYIGRRQMVTKPDLARFLARSADVQARTVEVVIGGNVEAESTRFHAAAAMRSDAMSLVADRPVGERPAVQLVPRGRQAVDKAKKVKGVRAGDISAAWTLLHAAELELLPELDAQHKERRTLAVEAELAGLTSSGAKLLREKTPHDTAWLLAATEFIYENKDNAHAEAASWHRRMFWLANVGCLGVLLLGVAVGDVRILLFGTLGGLASRLSRSLTQASAESDHGLRWSALFIAPVLGALAAPCGLLLLAAAGEAGVLGDKLKGIESAVFACGNACTPDAKTLSVAVVLGLAFILGFAERFLTGLIDKTIAAYLPADAK